MSGVLAVFLPMCVRPPEYLASSLLECVQYYQSDWLSLFPVQVYPWVCVNQGVLECLPGCVFLGVSDYLRGIVCLFSVYVHVYPSE